MQKGSDISKHIIFVDFKQIYNYHLVLQHAYTWSYSCLYNLLSHFIELQTGCIHFQVIIKYRKMTAAVLGQIKHPYHLALSHTA